MPDAAQGSRVDVAPPTTDKRGASWGRFVAAARKDVRLWVFCLAFLSLFRLLLILVFRGRLGEETGWREVFLACRRGFYFDAQISTTLLIPSLLFSVLCGMFPWRRAGDRLRLILGGVFLGASTFIGAIDLGYIEEYGDQFDQWVLGVFFDDLRAILLTIWHSYHVVPSLLLMLVVVGALVWALRRWLREPVSSGAQAAGTRAGPATRGLIVLGLAAGFFLTARGSIGTRPLQLKDAAITPDEFLNKLVPDPWHALNAAISDYLAAQRIWGLQAFIPDGDLAAAAARVFPEIGKASKVDDYLVRRAAGPLNPPPRHVFLMVMESYDAWPLLDRFRPLGLTESVRSLGSKGVLVTRFVPASLGTMSSLSAILTGLPDSGVQTDFQPSARAPFPTSPAAIFHRLGYRTRLFYAGLLSWHRIGEFCRNQGFEELHGGGEIEGGRSGNEWGAEDETLFRFVERTLTDDAPSFNLILSTSNHPPFDIDVYGKGFTLREMPAALAGLYDGRVHLDVLGHLWYSDRSAGRFIQEMSSRLPGSVFALTGDHWSRRFLNGRPDFYERSTVPLLLYGPETLRGVQVPERPVGGHLDIAPTLVELCAPAGFVYHTIGENILAPRRRLGLGWEKIVGEDFIAEIGAQTVIHPLTDMPAPSSPPDPQALRRLYNVLCGLGWWRVMKGNEMAPGGHRVPVS